MLSSLFLYVRWQLVCQSTDYINSTSPKFQHCAKDAVQNVAIDVKLMKLQVFSKSETAVNMSAFRWAET